MYQINKRLFDIFLSLVLMPLVIPLMIIAGLAIAAESGMPVFFTQKRIGIFGREFTIVKFRTMTQGERSGRGYLEKEHFTGTGRIMRPFHFDELPQIFLILAGTMSFVGPRPLVREHLEGFGKIEVRQSVKPGLVCTAQNELYEKKFLDTNKQIKLDLDYVNNACITADFRIILKAIALHWKRCMEVFSHGRGKNQ